MTTSETESQAGLIWQRIRQIYESFSERDEHGIDSVLSDDCTVWDVFEPQLIRGREERDAFHERDKAQSMARGPFSWALVPVELDIHSDLAIARYYLDFEYQPPGATRGRVRITSILKLSHGVWQVVHHHEGLSPSGPPPL
jgi:ketosteroid isomerase-like protein